MVCDFCKTPLPDGSPLCPICYPQLTPTVKPTPEATQERSKGGSGMFVFVLLLAIAAASILKGAAAVLGFCFVWFFFYLMPYLKTTPRRKIQCAIAGVAIVAVVQTILVIRQQPAQNTIAQQRSAAVPTTESPKQNEAQPVPLSAREKKAQVIEGIKDRDFYAQSFEHSFLLRGYSVTATTSGAEHRVLTLKWPLITKATAYQFQTTRQEDFDQMEIEGFKKFIMSNGTETWSFDLKPRQ